MDIALRTNGLQQVMSHFVLTCARDQSMKLYCSINYPKWHNHTSMIVAAQDADLDNISRQGTWV